MPCHGIAEQRGLGLTGLESQPNREVEGILGILFHSPKLGLRQFFLYYVRSKSGYVTKFNDYGSIARKCIRPK